MSSLCIHPLIMTIYYICIKIFYISNGLVPAGILLLLRPIKKKPSFPVIPDYTGSSVSLLSPNFYLNIVNAIIDDGS